MRYSVHCPSAPYENSSFVDIDDAWGLCLDLSEEFGYAEVRQGDHLLGSYTNGQWVSITNRFDSQLLFLIENRSREWTVGQSVH